MFPIAINPVAFGFIHWYGIILGLGAVAGLLIAIREGKRFGISADFFLDLMLWGVPSSIIAARIYYVVFKWDYYRDNPGEIIQIWNGGIAIYGALIGAFVCGWFFIKAKGYNYVRIADICVPSLLIGQMIGRWGNFVNQEAHGGPVEASFLRDTLHLPAFIVDQMNINGEYYHPTFLYESLWSLVGLILLFVIRRQKWLRVGEVLFSYLIWYSLGRFFIEALRTDSLAFQGPQWLVNVMDVLWSPMKLVFDYGHLDPTEGNIRSSQLLALLLVLFGVACIIVRRVFRIARKHYNDPLISTKPPKPAAPDAEPAATVVEADTGVLIAVGKTEPAAAEAGPTSAESSTDAGAERDEPGDTGDKKD